MKSNSDYKEFINASVKLEIVKQELDRAQITEFVSIADDQNYYLSDDGLEVYFQQYEYFPYAAGIVECNIQYDDMADYLKPELRFLSTAE